MEPAGSLPHSQQLVSCPCSEPDHPRNPSASHFLKIDFHIIFPSTSRSSKWALSLGLLHQIPVCTSCTPCMLHAPLISFFTTWWPKSIWWEVQIIKFLLMSFHPFPSYLVPFRPKYIPSTRCSATPLSYVSSWMWETKFQTRTEKQANATFDIFFIRDRLVSYVAYVSVWRCQITQSHWKTKKYPPDMKVTVYFAILP